MKNLVLIAALVAVGAMTSCSKTEIIEIVEGREITMRHSYVSTRTSPNVALEQGFNVLAVVNKPSDSTFLFNKGYGVGGEVAKHYYNGDTATSYNFYAVAPISYGIVTVPKTPTSGSITAATVTFVGGGNPDAAEYIAGEELVITSASTTGEQNGPLALKFEHQLTQVKVSAQAAVANIVMVTGVTISDVDTNMVINLLNEAAEIATGPVSSFGKEVNVEMVTADSIMEILPPMLVAPQAAESKVITLSYTIDGVPGSKQFIINEDWGKGTIVNYQFTIGPKEITFTPTVEKWKDETSSTLIPIPTP